MHNIRKTAIGKRWHESLMLCRTADKREIGTLLLKLNFDSWYILCSSFLEKNLRLLMDCVDELAQDSNKHFNYQRQVAKQQQSKQQYTLKRVLYILFLNRNFLNQALGFFIVTWKGVIGKLIIPINFYIKNIHCYLDELIKTVQYEFSQPWGHFIYMYKLTKFATC